MVVCLMYLYHQFLLFVLCHMSIAHWLVHSVCNQEPMGSTRVVLFSTSQNLIVSRTIPGIENGWYHLCMVGIFVYQLSNTFKARVSRKTGGWINIKMSSYHYRKSHCEDTTILRPSYLHNGISYTDKMTSLYWIRAQGLCFHPCHMVYEVCKW